MSAQSTPLNDLTRFADAQNVLLPALRMFPKNQHVATLNAWIAHYQKNFTEADKRWADIRERFPNHVPGYAGGGGLTPRHGPHCRSFDAH